MWVHVYTFVYRYNSLLFIWCCQLQLVWWSLNKFYEKKIKQWWSSIPPIPTKPIIISLLAMFCFSFIHLSRHQNKTSNKYLCYIFETTVTLWTKRKSENCEIWFVKSSCISKLICKVYDTNTNGKSWCLGCILVSILLRFCLKQKMSRLKGHLLFSSFL